MTLQNALNDLNPREKVTVSFSNGMYYSGRVKKVREQLLSHADREVRGIQTSFEPVFLHTNLQKEVTIFI